MPLQQITLTKDMTGATQTLPFTRKSQKAMAWCQSDEMGLWFIKKSYLCSFHKQFAAAWIITLIVPETNYLK